MSASSVRLDDGLLQLSDAKKKDSRNKRKVQEHDPVEKKEQKRRKKEQIVKDGAEPIDSQERVKTKKRKHKEEKVSDHLEGEETNQRKKRKGSGGLHHEDLPVNTHLKSRRQQFIFDVDDGERNSNNKPEPDNSKEFPSPNDDVSLSDQSKKALAYVFSQSTKPNIWKFNKARQNWLIRNLWSPQAIPDKYLTLVIRYLSNVQGRARETLIESCEKALAFPATESAEPVVQEKLKGPPDKQQRARLLLDALSVCS